jgi:outer membrane protein assembly factor BamA
MLVTDRSTIYTFARILLVLVIVAWISGGDLHAQITGTPAPPPQAVSVRPVLVGVEFEGNEGLSDDFLAAQIKTRPTVSSFIRRFFGIFTDIPVSTPRHRDALRRRVDSLTGEIRYLNLTTVAADTARLRNVYDDLGYHRARFAYRIRLDTTGNRAVVHYLIYEGPRFTLNGIHYIGSESLPEEIRTAMKNPEEFELGKDFVREDMNREVNRIVELLQNDGYAFAAVNNVVVLKLDTPYVAKQYDSALVSIYTGDRYRFGRTVYVPDTVSNIRGVTERAVRRQIEYEPGEWYSKRKVEQTVANLYSVLGSFELVRLDTTAALSSEDTLGMRLAVKLRKPRDLRITPEISFERRQREYAAFFGAGIEFTKANVFGEGERLSAQARVSSRFQDVTWKNLQLGGGLTYYTPTFLGLDRVSFSITPSADYAIEDRIIGESIETDTNLRSLRFAILPIWTWRLPKYTFLNAITAQLLVQRVGYINVGDYVAAQVNDELRRFPKGETPNVRTLVTEELRRRVYRTQILQGDSLGLAEAIDPEAAQYFADLKVSEIARITATTDRRNSFFAPTDGHLGNGTLEFGFNGASLNGWVKGEVDARIYRPVFDLSSLAARGHLGVIVPFGPITFVPLQSLFWAGGANSIRGWGPREMLVTDRPKQNEEIPEDLRKDIENKGKQFQGGLVLVELMLELRTRLFTFEGASALARQLNNFSLIGFVDAGNAYYRSYKDDSALVNFPDALANTGLSIGMSIGYDTPIGPFRVGFGVPIYDPVNYDPGKRWLFGSEHPLQISDFAWHVSIGHAF